MVLPCARRRSPAERPDDHHRASAVDLVGRLDGSEQVCLATGDTVIVDHVILTSGHTANQGGGNGGPRPRQLSPYPVRVVC